MARLSRILSRGAIVLLRTNGGDHLCIMLTDAFKRQGEGTAIIIQAHLTSSSDSDTDDPTCIFKAGDDRLITKDCWVYYEEAQVRKVAEIEAEIRKRNRKVRKISGADYKRIMDGLLSNPLAPAKVLDLVLEAIRQGKAG